MTAAVRPLTAADIPAAMRIKAAAGWNQTESDWHNLLRLAPDTCFGLECDGTLAATTTAICYGQRLAWVGMVLTDPAHRRRGFARRLMEHTLAALAERRMEWIKLDATDLGAALYRQLGFDDEAPVERWRAVTREVAPRNLPSWSHQWAERDRAVFGADRATLLDLLATGEAAAVPSAGYAMARPGSEAAYFGPCVASSPDAARELLDWVLSRHAGEPVAWDLLPHNAEAARLARDFGFTPVRRLVRMARAGVPGATPLVRDDNQVFAIAGFEFG